MTKFVSTWLALLPVYFYRFFISPLLGPRCRFAPSCSEYAIEAVRLHGVQVGLWLTLKRLARCHPFTRLGNNHGFDPVPVEILHIAWYAPWRTKSAAKQPPNERQKMEDIK